MIGTAYNSFGDDERLELQTFLFLAKNGAPLSGYLAGKPRGGDHVVALEEAWSEVFGVKHSIAVNSATSGLLAAAFASDLNAGHTFSCPVMTMSATAAAPCFTGAKPRFEDVNDEDFSSANINPDDKAVFVTNLFGHPATMLHHIRRECDQNNQIMIEDNSQSPFAMTNGRYTGTIGHIGVFSLNIPKPLQCGEGGMIVTNHDHLAYRMRNFINHGEHGGGRDIGLNLRMPEVCAVIAHTQLQRGIGMVNARIEQAEAIINAIGFIPGIRPPIVKPGCNHVYYTIPFLIDRSRSVFVAALEAAGVPVVERYAKPLHHMPAFQHHLPTGDNNWPVADALWERRLFYIENCAWTFSRSEIKKIGDAFKRAAEAVKL